MSNASNPPGEGFGVYVHWPFCAAKCPYCDFNSHVRHQPVDQKMFVGAHLREIAHMASLAPGRTVTSIFFGGGTPSLMEPETVATILDAIAGHWTRGARRRDHARGQPVQRRGGALSRLPRGGGQPGIAGRPVAGRQPS